MHLPVYLDMDDAYLKKTRFLWVSTSDSLRVR